MKFNNFEVKISFGRYPNNRPYIILLDKKERNKILNCTVNLPHDEIADDEVAVKNYSENAGMLSFLYENQIISKPVRFIESGYVVIPICKILKYVP